MLVRTARSSGCSKNYRARAVGWAIRAFYARLRRAMGAGTAFQRGRTFVRRAHVCTVHLVMQQRVGTAHDSLLYVASPCRRLCPPYETALRSPLRGDERRGRVSVNAYVFFSSTSSSRGAP